MDAGVRLYDNKGILSHTVFAAIATFFVFLRSTIYVVLYIGIYVLRKQLSQSPVPKTGIMNI